MELQTYSMCSLCLGEQHIEWRGITGRHLEILCPCQVNSPSIEKPHVRVASKCLHPNGRTYIKRISENDKSDVLNCLNDGAATSKIICQRLNLDRDKVVSILSLLVLEGKIEKISINGKARYEWRLSPKPDGEV